MTPNTSDNFFSIYKSSFDFEPCECCKIKYTSSTVTTRKWTEQEIKDEILELATMLSNKKWYESKSYLKSKLKHWCGKLSNLNEVRQTINK